MNKLSHRLGVQTAIATTSVALLIAIGTTAFHALEDWTWIQSFYFTVVTLTTVGYGDLHPTSDGSRLFTALFVLAGVAITVSALGVIGTTYLSKREARRTPPSDNNSS